MTRLATCKCNKPIIKEHLDDWIHPGSDKLNCENGGWAEPEPGTETDREQGL